MRYLSIGLDRYTWSLEAQLPKSATTDFTYPIRTVGQV